MAEFSIHQAAEEGDLKRVRQLIEGGVSVDCRDDRGRRPLHLASERGRYGVVELLISNKCDLNLEDCGGYTPVMRAADSGKKSVVDFLLQRGVQVNCANNDKWTLLHYSAGKGWTDVVQCILDRGEADPNAATRVFGTTPLMWAALNGHEEVAALLLRAGADVNRSDAQNCTALHWAAYRGRTRVVQVLLEEEGLELNPQDGVGLTALHKACCMGCQEVVKQLLIAGADTLLKNNQGETALSRGISQGKLTLEDIRLFVQHEAFLQDCDYKQISENPSFKESVLKDVDICTRSIVNKYHCQSLPALKAKLKGRLPSIDKFNLLPKHISDVENFVKRDIEANLFCNVIKARPIVLRILCVESLLA